MEGYALIVAVLVLGGTIATLGDRIGSKVGKARLSIFKLRPRDTATLVTILTGGLISASTLGIMLATSSRLREGLFQLETIRTDLATTRQEKERVEAELTRARSQREDAQRQLDRIDRSLVAALQRQERTQAQLKSAQERFHEADAKLQQVLTQERDLRERIATLTAEQAKLASESRILTAEKAKLSEELSRIERDREDLRAKVAESQSQLTALEQQRAGLQAELATLKTSRDRLIEGINALRRGNLAIQAEQVLVRGVLRARLSREEARQAIYLLLQQADLNARVLLDFPREGQPVIRVTDQQVEALLDRINSGESYVISILSAGNYLRKETSVSVLADITPNRQIFKAGEVIASLSFASGMTAAEREEQLDKLFVLVGFRAKVEGVLPNPSTGKVGSFPQGTIFELAEAIKQYDFPFEIRAIAKEDIFTGSTLQVELAIFNKNGEIRRFG